jgi:hypothetical protein
MDILHWMTCSWLVVPNSIGLIMSMLYLCLFATYDTRHCHCRRTVMKMMIWWDERKIKESLALIDNGVVVEEVDSSLRWGDGECLLDMDSGPKWSTDLTTSGLLFNRGFMSHIRWGIHVKAIFLILRIDYARTLVPSNSEYTACSHPVF